MTVSSPTMKRMLTEKQRHRLSGAVMMIEHTLLLPPSLYLLAMAFYLRYVVADAFSLVEGLDGHIAPLAYLLAITGIVNFISNWLMLSAMAGVHRPSTRARALRSVCTACIVLLVTTLLVLAASIYCFVQLGRLSTLFERGLNKSMQMYIMEPEVKARVDLLQLDYSCCGDSGYKDWFGIPWVGPDILVGDPKDLQIHLLDSPEEERSRPPWSTDHGFYYTNDDVPFSCCDPTSPRPCIHHHVVTNHLHYDYDHHRNDTTLHLSGCRRRLMEFFGKVILCDVALGNLSMFFLQLGVLAIARLTATSMDNAIDGGDITAPAEGYIFNPKEVRARTAALGERWALLMDSDDNDGDERVYDEVNTATYDDMTSVGQEEPVYINVIPDDDPDFPHLYNPQVDPYLPAGRLHPYQGAYDPNVRRVYQPQGGNVDTYSPQQYEVYSTEADPTGPYENRQYYGKEGNQALYGGRGNQPYYEGAQRNHPSYYQNSGQPLFPSEMAEMNNGNSYASPIRQRSKGFDSLGINLSQS